VVITLAGFRADSGIEIGLLRVEQQRLLIAEEVELFLPVQLEPVLV